MRSIYPGTRVPGIGLRGVPGDGLDARGWSFQRIERAYPRPRCAVLHSHQKAELSGRAQACQVRWRELEGGD